MKKAKMKVVGQQNLSSLNTIDKFNIAYKPVEVNGTKMKEILYGLNEFD